MYVNVIGAPMREGRMRFDVLDARVRGLSIAALAVAALLVASMLMADLWRAGPLLAVNEGDAVRPSSLFPVIMLPGTLVALTFAWILILVGGANSSVGVACVVSLAFILINAPLARAPFPTYGGPVLAALPQVTQLAYWSAAGLVIAAAWMRDRRAIARWRPLALGLTICAVTLMYLPQLAIHLDAGRRGIESPILVFVAGTFVSLEAVFLPLTFAAALGVMEFSLAIANASVTPLAAMVPRHARYAVLALLVCKILITLPMLIGEFVFDVGQRLDVIGYSAIALAAFPISVWAWRAPRADRVVAARAADVGILAAGFTLGGPLLAVVALSAASHIALLQFGWLDVADGIRVAIPETVTEQRNLRLIMWSGLMVVALALRSRGSAIAREVAIALFAVGAWGLHITIWRAFGGYPGLDLRLVDLMVTLAVTVYMVGRWRSVDARTSLFAAALVIFTWLFSTEGDLIVHAGALLKLGDPLVSAVGLVYLLLAGSSFANGNSPLLPRAARPLLWLGYIVLSLVLLNWAVAAHNDDLARDASRQALLVLGVPFAVWTVLRNPVFDVRRNVAVAGGGGHRYP